MSTKQITITIEGPIRTGKTYVMEKIAEVLKQEGIDFTVDCNDGDFGKYAERELLGEPLPSLKEVLEENEVCVVLAESHLSAPLALDPEFARNMTRMHELTKKLKEFTQKQPIYALVVSANLDLAKVLEDLPVRYSDSVQLVVLEDGRFDLPDTLEDKPLLLIWQEDSKSKSPNGIGRLKGMPSIFPFMIKSAVYLCNPHTVIIIRDLSLPRSYELSLVSWLKDIVQFIGEGLLNVIINPHISRGCARAPRLGITIKRLLEINPSSFILAFEETEGLFVKCPDITNGYATTERLLLPPCFEYAGPATFSRGGRTSTEHRYRLVGN